LSRRVLKGRGDCQPSVIIALRIRILSFDETVFCCLLFQSRARGLLLAVDSNASRSTWPITLKARTQSTSLVAVTLTWSNRARYHLLWQRSLGGRRGSVRPVAIRPCYFNGTPGTCARTQDFAELP